MSENLKKAQSIFNSAKQAANQLKDKAIEGYDKSGAKTVVEKSTKETMDFMDRNGITDKAEAGIKKLQEVTDIASENFDKVSGKRILEIVENRLILQTQYNDLLASKLEEALNRIEVLEKSIRDNK